MFGGLFWKAFWIETEMVLSIFSVIYVYFYISNYIKISLKIFWNWKVQVLRTVQYLWKILVIHHFLEHILSYAGVRELCLKSLIFQRINYILAKLKCLFCMMFLREKCLFFLSQTCLEDIFEIVMLISIKLSGLVFALNLWVNIR